jgi:hypothetical protein
MSRTGLAAIGLALMASGLGGTSEAAGLILADDPPGFGDSLLLPTGEPFVLPEGIELKIVSYNPFDKENTCKRPDAEEGEEPLPDAGLTNGFVNLCFQFSNRTFGPINVELPPGIIVISSNRENQHGMIFQRMNLEVPSEQDLYAPIKADCMNASRSAPGPGIDYDLGPVTDNRHIREALGILAGRDLSDPIDAATASGVMKPLYKGKALSHEGSAQLLELPPLRL